ncbi:outer membrane beta-barrel protein [Niastella sp. OAS944]|uniref:outer membrane beta-barrel protein n=1 Tax=Niastella sp. OAS944 TaxID=2664089 RepID=UPI00346CAA32|nr:hypothetical protein [Chitinophagaceae bacterium OAS944]
MKQRFLLSLLFVCTLAVTSQAQINKGATWLGGQVGYSQTNSESETTSKTKQTGFNFSPAVGTAVKENLILGVFVNYSTNKTKISSTNTSITTKKEELVGGGLFIRNYIPVVNRLYLFGDARVFYNSYKYTDKSNSPETKIKGFDAGISATPGLAFAVTDKIQIETGLNNLFSTRYQKRTQTQGISEIENKTFNTGLFLDNSSQVFIGFRFLINKKA